MIFPLATFCIFHQSPGWSGWIGWFWPGGLALAWCLVVRDSVWSKPLLAGYYSDPQVDYYTNTLILLLDSIAIILSEEDKNDPNSS